MFFDFDVDNRNDLSHILLDEQNVHDYVFKTVNEINRILDQVIQVPSAVAMHVWLGKRGYLINDVNLDMDWNALVTDVNGFTNQCLTLEQVHDRLIETFKSHKSVHTFKQLFDAMLTELAHEW